MNTASKHLDSTAAHPPATRNDATTAAQDTGLPPPHPPAPAQLSDLKMTLARSLRQYPDFPAPGVLFEDILPIFANPSLHSTLIDALVLHIEAKFARGTRPEVIVGLEARGFLFGPTLAYRLGAGFVCESPPSPTSAPLNPIHRDRASKQASVEAEPLACLLEAPGPSLHTRT